MSAEERDGGRGFTLQGDPRLDEAPEGALPRIDFPTFVLSIATSALYHMGLSADPSGKEIEKPNLPLARQAIDTLELLEEKTRGNLSDEESKLIGTVLYELRMSFLKLER